MVDEMGSKQQNQNQESGTVGLETGHVDWLRLSPTRWALHQCTEDRGVHRPRGCHCPRFSDSDFRIADLKCPYHGISGPGSFDGDAFWDLCACPGEVTPK